MSTKRRKKSGTNASLDKKPSGKPANHTDFMVWPVPRKVLVNDQLGPRYCKPGRLQFVDGNDRNYQTQSQHWQKLHPDLNRPQFDEEGSRVGLPPSWPPNFVMLAPEQQYAPPRRKPVHGGWTWPGHPAPTMFGRKYWLKDLPKPILRFFEQ